MHRTTRFWRKIFCGVIIYAIWQLSPGVATSNSQKRVFSTHPNGQGDRRREKERNEESDRKLLAGV